MAEVQRMIKMLLVEDSLDDIQIIKKALKEAKVINRLWIVRDGQEALDFLYHKGQFQDPSAAPRPGLILLDINLPRVNGLEVLTRIKKDPKLRGIPTVMLTVSKREEDLIRGYNNGCNSFIQKPVEFEKFVEIIKQIGLYWGVINAPSPNGPTDEGAEGQKD